ncbi:MAG: hypothetical protein LBI33_12895 [Propionibacteriaceae bacterium]|jgi:hypothetical protein|nr:hypothetical protein [Propionibacteriaceae bacterium]
MPAYTVAADAVMVTVGKRQRFVYHGHPVPAGVSEADLVRLAGLGMISPVPAQQADDADGGEPAPKPVRGRPPKHD